MIVPAVMRTMAAVLRGVEGLPGASASAVGSVQPAQHLNSPFTSWKRAPQSPMPLAHPSVRMVVPCCGLLWQSSCGRAAAGPQDSWRSSGRCRGKCGCRHGRCRSCTSSITISCSSSSSNGALHQRTRRSRFTQGHRRHAKPSLCALCVASTSAASQSSCVQRMTTPPPCT